MSPSRPHRHVTTLLTGFLCWLSLSLAAFANPPDLTSGGVPDNTRTINLGPTGLRGWVYHVNSGGLRADTTSARQILVTSVASGSPAADLLAVNDVILGASGTGATPVNFSTDARKTLAQAIADAEARNPATLTLLRWRSGTTTTVTLTLQAMGAYSATAPYDCPKSTLILQQGLASIMAGETSGRYSFGTLSLLAAKNPADPNNAARMARAQTEARALVPSPAVRTQMMADSRDATSMIVWERGHTLIVLAEYYLATGDDQVLPGIEAYAVNIARNSSLFGTMGHIFAEKNFDGSDNGPMGGFYGPVNNAGMPCYLGLILARECGITHASLTPAIERMNTFYGGYIGKGTIPYGEHEPFWDGHENNGKSGLAAVCYMLENDRVDEAKYYAKMATAAGTERERGHTGSFFSYVWSPLGAACGGEQAAASHFSRISWMLDLNRRWDHRFDYDCLNGEGPNSGSQYNDFRMSTAALLTYALPLRQLRITGKSHDNTRWIAAADVTEAAAVDGYSATTRTNAQLLADLGSWSPAVQRRAANQLATRTIDTATLNQLTTLANDPNGTSRVGACLTLGRISNSTTANARAATLAALLTDPENRVRFMAAEAMRYLPQSAKLTQLNAILTAAATTANPLFPFNEEDPLHFAHGRLAMLLFYGGNAYGPKGIIWNNLSGVDRSLLYPAIRAVAANPVGQARSCLYHAYLQLTAADVNALAGTLVESVRFRAPSDKMFSGGIRRGAMETLEKYKIAEGVPLSLRFMVDDGRADAYNPALVVLQKYAGASTTVLPDPDVVGFCQSLLGTSYAAAAQNVLNAIAASPNPTPLTPFKSIQSITADAANLNLPANQTTLRVAATDLAQGDTTFTWRKVRGAGNVSITPNGTAAAKDAAIQFDNVPGNYLFEVKMADSRGLTELYRTVEVTLRNPDGTLPQNLPPTAHPQSVGAIPGSPASITLTATDPESYPMVFSVTSPPAHGILSGTAPDLVYTADATYIGQDEFTFQAMDSEGLTSTTTVVINVNAAGIELYVYEPFDYEPGGLNGKSGTSEMGFDGSWHAQASAQIVADSLTYGSLPVLGRSIGNLNSGSNHYGGSRTVSTSALAAKGLLDDGATLWFSVVVGYGSGGNLTNSRLGFAFGNHRFSASNFQYYILNEGPQLGSGLGLTLGRFNGVNGKVVATQFRDSSHGTSGTTGNVFGNVPTSTIGTNQQRLVVGKITWGAAVDTIELFEPDANLNITQPTSTLTVNVDQSTFDTITWARGDVVTMDEIRFGNNLAAVSGVEGSPPDVDPPTLVSITDDRGGETLQQGEPVTYSLVFSEPMSAATVSPAAFGNAGTSAFTIQSVNQPLPNVVTVTLTPTTIGTLRFRIQQGAVLSDLAGNPLNTALALTDETEITVNPAMAIVPGVIGQARETAEATIAAAGLPLGTVTLQSDETAPAGTVISQSPSSGANVAASTLVDLLVSSGPPMTLVPQLAGLTQTAAEAEISAALLAVGTVTTDHSETVPAGVVILQNPAAGTSVAVASAVDLVVSLGSSTPPATDGTWNANEGGDWSDATKWLNSTIASGPGNTATVQMTTAGNRTITVDAPRTLGNLTRNWPSNSVLTLAGTHALTLAGPSPTITNTDLASNRRIEITAPISGTDGLTITGGMVQLSNPSSSYTGPTHISGFLDFTGMAIESIGGGPAAGRNITLTAGSTLRFNALSNAFLNRIAETSAVITVMTATTANPLDFSATGANLPNAFLGNWASNGAKTEYSGTLTPAVDAYRFGSASSDGLLGIRSALTGTQGVIIGGNRVELVNPANTFTGDTVIQAGRLYLGHNLALQNSALDVGSTGGTISFSTGALGGRITDSTLTASPTFGGLKGSRHLLAVYNSAAPGNNAQILAATEVTGFTLNPGAEKFHVYSGDIADFAPATTLSKTGPGTQVLSGNNTYTGTTTITEGTLALVGGGQTSPITVASGASLGLTLGSPTTSTATLDLTTGSVKITGIVDDSSDYLLITANTIAGTPTLETPIPGYELQVRENGTQLFLALVTPPTSPYDTWSGGAPFDADANADGIANGLAFLLGAATPAENATALLPTPARTAEGLTLTFKLRNSATRGTAAAILEWSTDLGLADPWTANTATIPESSSTINGVTFLITPNGPLNHITATIPSTFGRHFARIIATPAL